MLITILQLFDLIITTNLVVEKTNIWKLFIALFCISRTFLILEKPMYVVTRKPYQEFVKGLPFRQLRRTVVTGRSLFHNMVETIFLWGCMWKWNCNTASSSNQSHQDKTATNPNHNQSHKYHHLTMTLHLTLKMTITQAVERSVTNNSFSKDYPHLTDHTKHITDTPGFKPFTKKYICTGPINQIKKCPQVNINGV